MSPAKVSLVVGGVAVLVVVSHGAALAGGLGGGGGLSGAAATAHGLAVLGGGSVAGGGYGMAGGLLVLKGAAVVGGRAAATGVKPLLEAAGPLAVAGELAKLQTTAALFMDVEEGGVIADLEESLDELRRDLEEEQAYSDPSAKRLKDRKEAIEATQRAVQSLSEDSYNDADQFFAAVDGGAKAAGRAVRSSRIGAAIPKAFIFMDINPASILGSAGAVDALGSASGALGV